MVVKKLLKRLFKRKSLIFGAVLGAALVFLGLAANDYTSSDEFCESCHVHPHATESWKMSTHYDNQRGIFVHCVECHLPPGRWDYFREKTRLGIRDVYGKLFTDVSKIDWMDRSRLEHAATYTFKDACLRCHQNVFPLGMSEKGDEAHLYYSQRPDELRCISCHLHVGHYDERAKTQEAFSLTAKEEKEIFTEPTKVERFEDFTERIPGTSVEFDMIAIPGGGFTLGSPESEPYRDADEGPARAVKISPFWMARTEVTWDEYGAFYRKTASEGRTDTRRLASGAGGDVDAITGATPPYGNPDQGWGKGKRPAITMTHHAATVYCRWLSQVTGKKYRLPTEAEWEYACRGGSGGPYFFEGSPTDFTKDRLWNRLFGADIEGISPYVIYEANSGGRTQEPSAVQPNPYGLLNMSGNVAEFCLDWYAPGAYALYPPGETLIDPQGPPQGEEHVIRGGSFRSDAVDVRSAARDHTRHDAWLLTDPQIPKSIWWYSDCIHVGFRVVCEYEEGRGD